MPHPDYHVHSTFSFDGLNTVVEMARAAAERNLPAVGITDHLEFNPESKAEGLYDYDRVREAVEDAREILGTRIKILMGVEVGYELAYHEEIRGFLDKHPFDYILGSVHRVGGLDLSRDLFEGRPMEEAYRAYFVEALKAVESGFFDGFAHLDIPKRYGIQYYGASWNPGLFKEEISALLASMIEMDLCLEVNTSGLRQDPHEPYPGSETLELYRSLGGHKVSMGSDAHKVWDLAYAFQETAEALHRLGFTELHEYGREFRAGVKRT
jgi:histidinol-phosphatase (PHP family)